PMKPLPVNPATVPFPLSSIPYSLFPVPYFPFSPTPFLPICFSRRDFFVERREFAEAFHDFGAPPDDIVHLLFRIEASQAEADCGASQFVGEADGLENVRGRDGAGTARGAGGERHVVQRHHQTLAIHVGEGEVQIPRRALRLMSVDVEM